MEIALGNDNESIEMNYPYCYVIAFSRSNQFSTLTIDNGPFIIVLFLGASFVLLYHAQIHYLDSVLCQQVTEYSSNSTSSNCIHLLTSAAPSLYMHVVIFSTSHSQCYAINYI